MWSVGDSGRDEELEEEHEVLQHDDQEHRLGGCHGREHAVHRPGQSCVRELENIEINWGKLILLPMRAQLTITPITPIISIAVCQQPIFCLNKMFLNSFAVSQ